MIGQAGEKRLEGIEDYALGANGIDGVPKSDEQSFEIVFAGLFDLATFDVDVIEHEFFLRLKLLQIESQRADVGGELGCVFLEHHEDTGLAELRCAAHEEFHGQHGFATARAARDKRWPPGGQPPPGYLV